MAAAPAPISKAAGRMLTRYTQAETMKPPLVQALGYSPDTDADRVPIVVFCWIRAYLLATGSMDTRWINMTWGKLYLIMQEWIIRPPVSPKAETHLTAMWADLLLSTAHTKLLAHVTTADSQTTIVAKWKALIAAIMADLSNFPEISPDIDVDTAKCALVMAIQKRGQATDAYCNKTRGDLIQEGVFNPLVACGQTELKAIWYLFEKLITKNLLQDLTSAPTSASTMRLNLVMQRIATTGMTPLRTILDMQALHPKFPWDEFFALFPGEKAELDTAKAKLAQDPFLAYDRNANAHGMTKYPYTFALAKGLKEDVNMDKEFRGYKGDPRVSRISLVQKIVTEYKKALERLESVSAEPIL